MNRKELDDFLEKSNKKLAFYEKMFNICIAVSIISSLVILILIICEWFGVL